ncbi:MAG: leucyl/phenylalanyl-tRNA--protein transferase [Planctomycetes bacterium]|nr:leucyl/phenylalanyl-tRNA--protein transferase [Planctomycetota bacterium]
MLLHPGVIEDFPDPRRADPEGLVAIGGDLSVERLLLAYEQGVFPWFNADHPELWWSPDPRAVVLPQTLHVSRSMLRCLRGGRFHTTRDAAFGEVIRGCAENREDGTWIVRRMITAYTALHRAGHAHSLEVWEGERLVGGIYGVHRGGLFAAESMFHRATNASKVALIELVRWLGERGVELVDVQLMTPHLATMGAIEIRREAYLRRVEALVCKPVTL